MITGSVEVTLDGNITYVPDTAQIIAVTRGWVEEYVTDRLAIQRVRELHKAFEETNENGFVNICCSGCYDEDSSTGERFHDRYPCPTIKALDGEQS